MNDRAGANPRSESSEQHDTEDSKLPEAAVNLVPSQGTALIAHGGSGSGSRMASQDAIQAKVSVVHKPSRAVTKVSLRRLPSCIHVGAALGILHLQHVGPVQGHCLPAPFWPRLTAFRHMMVVLFHRLHYPCTTTSACLQPRCN